MSSCLGKDLSAISSGSAPKSRLRKAVCLGGGPAASCASDGRLVKHLRKRDPALLAGVGNTRDHDLKDETGPAEPERRKDCRLSRMKRTEEWVSIPACINQLEKPSRSRLVLSEWSTVTLGRVPSTRS